MTDVLKAKAIGARSRAFFKLEQINDSYKIIRTGAPPRPSASVPSDE